MNRNLNAIWLLGRSVGLELVRKKDLYVLFMFMSLFLCGVLVMKLTGIEDEATAAFLLNLGMTMASILTHISVIVLAAQQIPNELENRTLYPLLARPVSRGTILLGKWLACSVCGTLVFLMLFVIGWVPVPKMGEYDGLMLVQALLLQSLSLTMASALAILFSLFLPKGVNILLTAGLVFTGSKLITLAKNQAGSEPATNLVTWLTAYLPDFSKLNVVVRYTDGISALGAGTFFGILLYALVIIFFSLSLGNVLFSRRAI